MWLPVLAALCLVGLTTAPAGAHHVALVRSDPPPGAGLDVGPRRVTARFDRSVEVPGSSLAVTDRRGVRLDRGGTAQPTGEPSALAVDLPSLAPGDYTVTWRVTSQSDGEFNQGSFAFTVRPRLTPQLPDRSQLGPVGLVLLVLGALILGGGACASDQSRRVG